MSSSIFEAFIKDIEVISARGLVYDPELRQHYRPLRPRKMAIGEGEAR